MVDYACDFSLSELGKYFEWVIICFNQQTIDALDQWEGLTDLGKYFVIAIISIVW